MRFEPREALLLRSPTVYESQEALNAFRIHHQEREIAMQRKPGTNPTSRESSEQGFPLKPTCEHASALGSTELRHGPVPGRRLLASILGSDGAPPV